MSLFLPLIDAFNSADVSYVLVGGMATVLHGYPRVTGDLDFVLLLEEENLKKAISLATNLGYIPRVPVNPLHFANSTIRRAWIEEKGLTVFSLFLKDNPIIGLDFFVEYPVDYQELYQQAVYKNVGKSSVRICSIDHLIQMKEKVARPKDIDDVAKLRLIKNDSQKPA